MKKPVLAIALLLLGSTWALAAGGTSQVASKGSRVTAQAHWPKGMEELLNDPARTDGWNSWFTEWPNDVSHYQFDVKSMDEVNALVAKLAAIKAEKLQLRLSVGKEPQGFGWVSRLPKGNKTAVLYSMGDQSRLNEWFARLPGGKFGVMEFEKTPEAVPPTLTLFVEHEAIDLAKLRVPANVEVVAGYLPGNFHVSNLKEKPAAKPAAPPPAKELDPATKKAAEAIEGFLQRRRQRV